MVDARHRPKLLLEIEELLGIEAVERLEGHCAAVHAVPRLVHDAHAPLPDTPHDVEATEHREGRVTLAGFHSLRVSFSAMTKKTALGAAVLLAVACNEPAKTGAPPNVSTAPAAPRDAALPIALATDAAAATTTPEVPDLAKALVPQHVPPIYVGKGSWLVFVGPKEAVHAVWTVSAESKTASVITDFPIAVRVLGAAHQGEITHILLESVAALDQPPGLHAVVRAPDSTYFGLEDVELDLSDVADLKALEARVAALPPPSEEAAQVGIDTDAPINAHVVASHLAQGGVELYRMWQSTFARPLSVKVDAASLGSAPNGEQVVETVRAAAMGTCGPSFCPAHGDMGAPPKGGLSLDKAGKIARVYLHELPGTVPNPQPKKVASSGDGAGTRAAMQERLHDMPFDLLGEAPLAASGGTVGVTMTKDNEWTVVFADGPAVSTVTYAGQFGEKQSDVELRFADLDGDGRTDVVLRSKTAASAVDGTPGRPHVRAAMAPRTVNAEPDDYSRELAMLGATSIDDAVKIAMAVPNRGVLRDDACKLLGKATSVPGFRSICAPGAAFITFTEPGDPSYLPTVTPAAKVAAEDVKDLVERCEELACDPARPFCQSTHHGPGSEHYVFTWVGTVMKLLYATGYRGT